MQKIFLTALAACVVLATAARADVPVDAQYSADRNKAIAALTPELKKRCLHKLSGKNDIKPIGELSFNDSLSRKVYREMFWNRSDRGVAFTVPVKSEEGLLGNVACFYALTDEGLYFQLSQQVVPRF